MPIRSALFVAVVTSLCVAVVVPPVHAQQSDPPAAAPSAPASAATAPVTKLPAYDVISVKVNNSASHSMMLNFTPDGMRASNLPVQFLLLDSFAINADQLINAPGWAKSISYDIEAKVAPEDVPALKTLNREQREAMILDLLKQRFQLAYHRETRTLPEYNLVIAKGGPKLEEFKQTTDENGKPRGGRMMMSGSSVTAEGMDIPGFARLLANRVGHPVVDKTGLTGKYSFKLNWANEPHDGERPGGLSHDAGPDSASAPGDNGPSIFTALQEQLGLKLEAEKGPVDVIVIDHLEQPAAD